MTRTPSSLLIVAAVLDVAVVLATLKVADVAPPGTDTLAGGVSLALLLESVTVTAAAAAVTGRITDPRELLG